MGVFLQLTSLHLQSWFSPAVHLFFFFISFSFHSFFKCCLFPKDVLGYYPFIGGYTSADVFHLGWIFIVCTDGTIAVNMVLNFFFFFVPTDTATACTRNEKFKAGFIQARLLVIFFFFYKYIFIEILSDFYKKKSKAKTKFLYFRPMKPLMCRYSSFYWQFWFTLILWLY